MCDCMTQEDAMNMSNEQAIQILKPFRDMMIDQHGCPISAAVFALDKAIEALSAQPERTKYIQDTKAVPSDRDCVDLSEKVTATFYDDEHEEWSQRTVTIRDVLDSVCDSYTVIEPERKTGKWLPDNRPGGGFWVCSSCKFPSEAFAANVLYKFCPNCGAFMK